MCFSKWGFEFRFIAILLSEFTYSLNVAWNFPFYICKKGKGFSLIERKQTDRDATYGRRWQSGLGNSYCWSIKLFALICVMKQKVGGRASKSDCQRHAVASYHKQCPDSWNVRCLFYSVNVRGCWELVWDFFPPLRSFPLKATVLGLLTGLSLYNLGSLWSLGETGGRIWDMLALGDIQG